MRSFPTLAPAPIPLSRSLTRAQPPDTPNARSLDLSTHRLNLELRMDIEKLLAEALAGDEVAISMLVEHLEPVIRRNVWGKLRSPSWNLRNTDLPALLDDLVQDRFVELLEDDTLSRWDPNLNLPLERYVGMVARRRTVSFLLKFDRAKRREETVTPEFLEIAGTDANPERRALMTKKLAWILLQLEARVDPYGWWVFKLLFIREKTVQEVSEETGLSREAVYQRRSRLRKLARQLAEDYDQGGYPRG